MGHVQSLTSSPFLPILLLVSSPLPQQRSTRFIQPRDLFLPELIVSSSHQVLLILISNISCNYPYLFFLRCSCPRLNQNSLLFISLKWSSSGSVSCHNSSSCLPSIHSLFLSLKILLGTDGTLPLSSGTLSISPEFLTFLPLIWRGPLLLKCFFIVKTFILLIYLFNYIYGSDTD